MTTTIITSTPTIATHSLSLNPMPFHGHDGYVESTQSAPHTHTHSLSLCATRPHFPETVQKKGREVVPSNESWLSWSCHLGELSTHHGLSARSVAAE